MIEVRNLTKKYGTHAAVSNLSFTIEKGKIYGFLGPNGAGKSTTMNIITGCLGATEGEVLIDGHSISDEPLQAKRLIGYLPEQPPLYTDMTPNEYLHFVASAKGITHAEQAMQINQVMEKTAIVSVQDRMIKNLSKGYKQRVGIAQALLGNPEVIILDEPTVGLDPAQIIEIRDLIRELGKDHTIILSSHILSEVQAVCDSIMIISNGHLVASDTPENLTRLFAGTITLHLEVKGGKEETEEVLNGIEQIEDQKIKTGDGDTTLAEIKPAENVDIRETVFSAFANARLPLLEMRTVRASLEDVFLELTQGDVLPDDQAEQIEANKETDDAESTGREADET
ncbi:MAG: ABC transporter ATP-binding protein [Clostridia bacterium]|nr:ABC transporter ATP-binding protein [Clostridia bacterium]MBR1710416.1 ABC transporter ATP-binding protein [Clostridia bacterium]